MSEEENKGESSPVCEECSCTGWKVGFYIFVALSIILFIIVLILFFSKKAQQKTTEWRVNTADAISNKLNKWSSKKKVLYDENGEPAATVSEEGQIGGEELNRLLSSLSE